MSVYDPSRPLRLTHFTPTSKAHWRYAFLQPIMTLTGPQRTITGHVVDCTPGITAWSGCGFPSFDTLAAAEEWASAQGLVYDLDC